MFEGYIQGVKLTQQQNNIKKIKIGAKAYTDHRVKMNHHITLYPREKTMKLRGNTVPVKQ